MEGQTEGEVAVKQDQDTSHRLKGNHQRIKKKTNIFTIPEHFFLLRWGSLSRLSGQVSLSETDKRQNFQKSKLKRLFAEMAQVRRMTKPTYCNMKITDEK